LIDGHGTLYIPDAWGRKCQLLPADKFADYTPLEPTIPRTGDPYREWITACKGSPPALSQFDYLTVLTETILLGIVAVRTGKKIRRDARTMQAPNAPEADAYVRREHRSG